MPLLLRKLTSSLLVIIAISLVCWLGYQRSQQLNPSSSTPMKYPTFSCAYEKDHNPPLDPEADKYFQQARALEKKPGIRDWPAIVSLYEKAIAKDHWKAMNNLAILYRTGKRAIGDPVGQHTAIRPDKAKMLALYARMVQLKVPMGYYNWAVAISHGEVPDAKKGDYSLYMKEAAEKGYPLAQVQLGNYFAFGLPQGEQRDDIAQQFFKCAGAQDNPEALEQVAEFYEIAKKNKPLALYFYQKAASLGGLTSMMVMKYAFEQEQIATYNFGYPPNKELETLYINLYNQLDANPDLKFPNLLKDHPLPRHPTQGYDADNPEVRPDY